jgi:hypothetical protein
VGLDGLRRAAVVIALLAACLTGCHGGKGRPERLLYGESAAEFEPVSDSVITVARVLTGTALGRRFTLCRPSGIPADVPVVERIGVFAESLSFADRRNQTIYACDGGVDPAGERRLPWCGLSAGRLVAGRLLDPRLDIGCHDREGRPIAYAWVVPTKGAHWIGVDQGRYIELYEVLGKLPVRIATGNRIEVVRSRATFVVTQYDSHGKALIKGKLEAGVAG